MEIGECSCFDEQFKDVIIGLVGMEKNIVAQQGYDTEVYDEILKQVQATPTCVKDPSLQQLIEQQIEDEKKASKLYIEMADRAEKEGKLSATAKLIEIAKQESGHKETLKELSSEVTNNGN